MSEGYSSREWWHAPFGYVIRAILALARAEKEGRTLSVTELINEARIPPPTFYRSIKRALVEGGFAEITPSPRERIIEVRLTEKGRRFARCIEEVGIGV